MSVARPGAGGGAGLRVAVTGSSGFIGRHVAAALAARGGLVTPLRRPFQVDTLTAALRDVDVVVHLAGVIAATRERDFAAGNVEVTRLVAQASRNAGARLVHVSSLAAAGPAPASAPRSEDDEPAPITAYGRTKLEGERIVSGADGLRWMILRPGVVYGPGDRTVLRVGVSGSSGFIGRHVTAALAARGDRVTPLRRPFEPAAGLVLLGLEALGLAAALAVALRPARSGASER